MSIAQREIKFRFYDHKNKEMVTQECSDRLDFVLAKWEVTPKASNVMQFTGLHDKNGKEIYEGDIIEFTPVDRVIISYYCGQFLGCGLFNGKRIARSDYEEISLFEASRKIVIGNIYENPSLLEESK